MRVIHLWKAVMIGVPALLAFTYSSESQAQNTDIVIEAIDDYTFYCGNGNCNTDAVEEAQPFWNSMTASGAPWTGKNFWQNGDVWDTDFYDPDLTGNGNDQGDAWFDVVGGSIAWAIGHGHCDDISSTICTTDADCAAVGGYCPKFGPLPTGASKVCIKEKPRAFVTSSSTNQHANEVWYGQTPLKKSLAIGEDYVSGGFDGAGTNGGMNIFLLTNSCGMRSNYWIQDSSYVFAGVHSWMMHVPTGAWWQPGALNNPQYSDTPQWSSRGSTLANLILANIYAPASTAWLNPTFVSGSTPSFGANLVISQDINGTKTNWHIWSETWNQAKYDSNDATGNGWAQGGYVCNYDCATYGF